MGKKSSYIVLGILVVGLSISTITLLTDKFFSSKRFSINFENLGKSVLKVKVTSAEEEKIGTCFCAERNIFVTTQHLLELDNKQSLTISLCANSNGDSSSHDATVLYEDKAEDIAILKCDLSDYVPKLSFGNSCTTGDVCYSFGNANELGISLFKGIVSNPKVDINYQNKLNTFIESNIEIYPGCSGGCLLDKNGNCLGMQAFRLKDINGNPIKDLSYSIPAARISKALKFVNNLENNN